MWIRSQNKEVLINANAIVLFGIFREIIGNYIVDKNRDVEILLGEYSTKEKSLKVLDMIQDTVVGNYLHSNLKMARDCDLTGTEFHHVFQMPQDNEVIVDG